MEKYSQSKNLNNNYQNVSPAPGRVLSIANNNNNQNKNPNENKGIVRPKKIISKKNFKAVKVQNRNERINDNYPLPKKDLGLTSDDNLDHPKPLISDYYDEGKDDIRKIFADKQLIKENSITKKEEKKAEGYLEDDLDDEDNQKIYLRVIKRLEKTLGIPVIGDKIVGGTINDIEIEDNIRPILINDNNITKSNEKDKSNKVSDNQIVKGKEVNNNNEKKSEQKLIYNNQINNNNINNNNINKNVKTNNRKDLNNNDLNIIFENNEKKREIDIKQRMNNNGQIIKKNIEMKNTNNINMNNSVKKENNNTNKNNKMISYNSNNNNNTNKTQPIYNKINNQNLIYKNNNYSYNYNSQQKKTNIATTLDKKPNNGINYNNYISFNQIHNQNNNQNKNQILNQNKNQNNIISKISYSNSNQNLNKSQVIQISNQKNLINNNNNINQQYINQSYMKNKTERKPIYIKNQNYDLSRSLPISEFNNVVVPDMQRGTEIFVKQNESELNSAKIKTQTYIRGGKFNNVQTTYVVYSKKENPSGFVKNRRNIIDNYNLRNRKLNSNTSGLFPKTPAKNIIVEKSSTSINKNNNIYNNDFYQFSSPKTGIQRNLNGFNSSHTIDNIGINRSQNRLPINRPFEYYNRSNNYNNNSKINDNYRTINYNIFSDRNNYSHDYRNTNFNSMNQSHDIKSTKYYNNTQQNKKGTTPYRNYQRTNSQENKSKLTDSIDTEYYNY